MSRLHLLVPAFVLACIATSNVAHASATFPPLLKDHLSLAELPYGPMGCQLCHQDDKGGVQTATKPFGRAMLKAGTVGGNPPSMIAALDRLAGNGTDSDGDGVGDIDELKAGTDPNVPAEGSGAIAEQVPLPQTGCSTSAPPPGTPLAPLAASVVAAVLVALRRRTRE